MSIHALPLFAHVTQLQPGACVLDNLRCRKTVLEIISPPEETCEGMLGGTDPETGSPIVSSWMIDVRDTRNNRQTRTRIDCDHSGYTTRFSLLK
jgi:hypothetical protein